MRSIPGYALSCLSGNISCTGVGANPNPANVVFRPWESTIIDTLTYQTPAVIGAPNGPYKRKQA
jgi:hypothetical protein